MDKFLNKKRFQPLLYLFKHLTSQFQFVRHRVSQRYYSLEEAVFQLLVIGKTMIECSFMCVKICSDNLKLWGSERKFQFPEKITAFKPSRWQTDEIAHCIESILYLIKHALIPQFTCFYRVEMGHSEMPYKCAEEKCKKLMTRTSSNSILVFGCNENHEHDILSWQVIFSRTFFTLFW